MRKLDHKFWAKYFRVYDNLNLIIPYQELLSTLVDKLEVKKSDVILDAGCGTGNLGVLLKKGGAKVIGVDYCIEALDVYKEKDLDAEIMVHDLTEPLPFPDNYFDKVVSNNVMYTFDEKNKKFIITEFYRVLKKGGVLVVADPIPGTNPILIFLDHLKKEIKSAGKGKVILNITKKLLPIIKIINNNRKIINNNKYVFFENKKHEKLFKDSGFNVKEILDVYSEQAIAIVGVK